MKNLIIAALAAAQIMDRWCVYCKSQEDITWSLFCFFFLTLLLLRQADKYAAHERRMREANRKIRRLTERRNLWESSTQ